MKAPALPVMLAAGALAMASPGAAQETNAAPKAADLSNPDNPVYVPPPAVAKPHVSEVQQPDQPGETAPAVAPGVPGSSASDPTKIADFVRRFKEGNSLQEAGKLAEARKIYEGILADNPNARGSLFEAGKISLRLGELAKADDYLSRLHQLEPNFPAAIELLIQINQALKRDVKVELLLREFRALHDDGKNSELARSRYFVRERIARDGETIVVSQFFDYTIAPNTVWMGEVFDGAGTLKQRVLLNYDAAATKALRAKDTKFQAAQIFTWFGHELTNGQVTKIDAYLQIFALPDYPKFRSALLLILAQPPKPIYSAPVSTPAATSP